MRALAPVIALLCALWLSTSTAHAQEAELKLSAQGGATLQVPASWKETRAEPGLIVREQAAEPAAQKPFLVALVAIEEGPPVAAAGVPWTKVRDNIQQAASKNGRIVTLTLDEGAITDVPGFEARRMHGELTSPPPAGAPAGTAPRKVNIELVALVKDKKLVTVGVVSEVPAADTARAAALTIAKTARLGN